MAVSQLTSSKYLPAISSMSLGRAAHHALEPKLVAAAAHGFRAIELFYEDLEYVARSLPASHPASPPGTSFANSSSWDEAQLAAASYIGSLCRQNGLDALCLQPFMHYDGLLCPDEHKQRIEKLKLWFLLAKRLNTDLIQIPSNFLPESQCTGDRARIVADLQEVADMGLQQQPVIRFAYEALCWGTHVDFWEQAWDVVKAVDRVNFGTCLDTFNIAGRVWGDPEAEDGRVEAADEALRLSLDRMRQEVDVKKVFYVEVVDAERMRTPLRKGHEWWVDGQKARMSWSRNARLFPFETESRGGYLPVLEILRVITEEVGYTGYVSFEYFSRSMNEVGEHVPEEHARRGEVSWGKLVEYMGWNEQRAEKMGEKERVVVVQEIELGSWAGGAEFGGTR
jgi:4-hydroxyphenylpyruvate dioxygenase